MGNCVKLLYTVWFYVHPAKYGRVPSLILPAIAVTRITARDNRYTHILLHTLHCCCNSGEKWKAIALQVNETPLGLWSSGFQCRVKLH
jgi:hypothetical protein